MNPETLVGAQLVVGFDGTVVTDDLIRHLRAIHAQNLIVFERNYTSPDQFRKLIDDLQEALGRSLLVMVDHEGGRIIRFKSGVTQFADAATAAKVFSSDKIEHQGRTEARELKRLGVSVNLAPCVDVSFSGCDPVIGDRSYGSDPSLVSLLSVARIRGLQSQGVAACAKHFPGLGAVRKDPHKTLPSIELDRHTIDSVHLAPFRAAISADVSMIMSSHVCYPRLIGDEQVPATFSPALIKEFLKKSMGFSGLVLTDDLEMGALSSFGSMGEIASAAARAGHDLLLICSDLKAQKVAFSHLLNLLNDNKISKNEAEENFEKLTSLRRNLGLES